MFDAWRTHLHDAADRIVRELLVRPTGDRRLQKRLVGIGGGGLVFGATQHDPRIGLLCDMHHHVGILVVRPLRTITFRIGIGRDVKEVLLQYPADMTVDIVAETWIDLVEHVPAVEERPHLADRLVADARKDATDVVEIMVDRPPFLVPVRFLGWRSEQGRVALARLSEAHDLGGPRLVRHVVHAGLEIHDRLESGMRRNMRYALAVDPDLPSIAQPGTILLSATDHALLASGVKIARSEISGAAVGNKMLEDRLFRYSHGNKCSRRDVLTARPTVATEIALKGMTRKDALVNRNVITT